MTFLTDVAAVRCECWAGVRVLYVDRKGVGMTYYKVLKAGGKPANGGTGTWHLPKGKRPGKWMPKIDDIELCERGYHFFRREDLVYWLDEEIWEVKVRGDILFGDDKGVAQQARLIRKVETWNEKTARLFAADCAENVLHIWEKEYPEDKRPHDAIAAARSYAHGEITFEEMSAAWYAARSASVSAWYAAGSAWYAARSAAGYAARSAAGSAAGYAARYAAGSWQTEKLFEYLNEVD